LRGDTNPSKHLQAALDDDTFMVNHLGRRHPSSQPSLPLSEHIQTKRIVPLSGSIECFHVFFKKRYVAAGDIQTL
jgi:hypothetical protein